MKAKLTLILLAFAAVSLKLQAAPSQALPAPLPEWMNDAQAAQWSADQAAAAQTTSAPEPSTQFYTGKPYVADAGGYIYKYRTYNPEMSRWTSADPSGFPDGANNQIYAGVPLSGLDPDGLWYLTCSGNTTPSTFSSTAVDIDTNVYHMEAIASLTSNLPTSGGSAPNGTVTAGGWALLYSSTAGDLDSAQTSANWTVKVNSSGDISFTTLSGAQLGNTKGSVTNTSTISPAPPLSNNNQTLTFTWNVQASGDGGTTTQSIMTVNAVE